MALVAPKASLSAPPASASDSLSNSAVARSDSRLPLSESKISPGGGVLQPDPLFTSRIFSGFRLKMSSKRVTNASWTFPAETGVLVLNRSGALLTRSANDDELCIIPADSLWIGASTQIELRASKGHHDLFLIAWPLALTESIRDYLSGCPGLSRSLQMGLEPAATRLQFAIENATDRLDIALLSVIYEIVASAESAEYISSRESLRLTPPAIGAPTPILELLVEMRADPTHAWTIAETSNRAGYSPYHFSRLFRSLFGFGLPEYIERLRCEMAANALLGSALPVEDAGRLSGLGGVPKVREAIRDYLGFVPDDLRTFGRSDVAVVATSRTRRHSGTVR